MISFPWSGQALAAAAQAESRIGIGGRLFLRRRETQQLSVFQRHIQPTPMVDGCTAFDGISRELFHPGIRAVFDVHRDKKCIFRRLIGMPRRHESLGRNHKTGKAPNPFVTPYGLRLYPAAPIIFQSPPEISLAVEQNKIQVTGIDKQLVGQVASIIRAFKKPEPYKGKGIMYEGEYVRRKAGKTGV